MSDEIAAIKAAKLAKEILSDLRGAAYYADPKVLAPRLRTGTEATAPKDEEAAVEVIRKILHLYANGAIPDRVEAELARLLETIGPR
jgi:hypothetical protein